MLASFIIICNYINCNSNYLFKHKQILYKENVVEKLFNKILE